MKNLIDSIVDLIADDERVSNLYGLWYEQKFNIIRTYTDEMPVKIPLSQNKEFKSVKNMIINQAMNIVLEKDVFDDDDEMIEKNLNKRKNMIMNNSSLQIILLRIYISKLKIIIRMRSINSAKCILRVKV